MISHTPGLKKSDTILRCCPICIFLLFQYSVKKTVYLLIVLVPVKKSVSLSGYHKEGHIIPGLPLSLLHGFALLWAYQTIRIPVH